LQAYKQLGERSSLAVNPLAQRLAFDVLHGHEVVTIGFTDLIDVRDVGVVERSHGIGLLLKAMQSLFALAELCGQEFEGDWSSQLRVLCEVYFTHPTGAEQ
jgi:hypothetical protein